MERLPLKVIAEKFSPFKGRTIQSVSGNTTIKKEIPEGEKILDVKTRGKLLFFEFAKFSFLFYETKRKDEPMRPELQIYNKKVCPRCGGSVRRQKMGHRRRVSYVCSNCQDL
jgi:formamidopyrimidine-DNA glycosylase